ncbi:C-4 sterol methyl oxidase [Naegleria gruberi]|uniref:C-4 sterol methyl oxidase n=1 Tax=Naegleria gruberi TaxID=5762 RepID=D2VMQ7_NAEGR|nr:C-4 sterol methyl oxidase [Naegleria gruberi]EFC41775.1 C-4 sterol methyl oxidase [Naegleria gruberi]|eukprot:XP_002674519.1 C-4 sterol methyl oxidase [Naegleria gruberi strain NEG-M]
MLTTPNIIPSSIIVRLFILLFFQFILSNFIERLWNLIYTNEMMRSTLFYTTTNNLLMVILYGLFCVVDKMSNPDWRLKGPIKSSVADSSLYGDAWLYFWRNTGCSWTIASLLTYLEHGDLHGGFTIQGIEFSKFPKQAPGFPRFIMEILFMLLCIDFFMYWMHRAYHWGFLYKYIHSVHHEYHEPISVNATSVHVVEIISMTVVVFIVPKVLYEMIELHPLSIYCISFITTVHVVLEHCGYDDYFEWLTFGVIPVSKMHFVHHQLSRVNYGFYFYFWDWLFGTKMSYEEMDKLRQKGKKEN